MIADDTCAGGEEEEMKHAEGAVGLTRPRFDQLTVWCSSCGSQCEMQRCRVIAKKGGTWRCSSCNTKMVQLHRGFGTWPTVEWASVPPEQQQAFFRSLVNMPGTAAVAACRQLMSKHESHETYYEFAGEYLPLKVWGTRGSTRTT